MISWRHVTGRWVTPMTTTITDAELHYLRSILRNLREFSSFARPLSLGGEMLADNIDWLDCFIDQQERAARAK